MDLNREFIIIRMILENTDDLRKSEKYFLQGEHHKDTKKSNCCSDIGLRFNDFSTIASLSAADMSAQPGLMPDEAKETALVHTKKNYYCFVNNCNKGYKYLYLFKYHLAGHEIFHFDCNLCNRRFNKYLLFKKHFKVSHKMAVTDYKVSCSLSNCKEAKITQTNSETLSLKAGYESTSDQLEVRKTLDVMLNDFLQTVNLQQKKQFDDFACFNPSILKISNPEFPLFGDYLSN